MDRNNIVMIEVFKEALNDIQNYCKGIDYCKEDGCPFFIHNNCLFSAIPEYWDIEMLQQRRTNNYE